MLHNVLNCTALKVNCYDISSCTIDFPYALSQKGRLQYGNGQSLDIQVENYQLKQSAISVSAALKTPESNQRAV
jgi:hypothetical protein